MNRLVAIFGAVVVGTSAIANAQPAPGVDQGVVDDAMSPGAAVAPTALTEPARTFTASIGGGADTSFNNQELTNVSASYAITNKVTVSGSLLLPSEDFRIYVLTGKYQFLRSGRLRLAAQANLFLESDDKAGPVGLAATYCLDDACNSHASGYVGAGIFSGEGTSVPIALDASLVAQIVPHVKLVGELATGFITGNGSGFGDDYELFYGVRVTSRNIGVNLGLVKAFGDLTDDGPGAFFASVTGRIL